MSTIRNACLGAVASAVVTTMSCVPASAQQTQKPNILLIMGDDIGYWNISAYNRGQMGYHTPNIDRIANEGAIFTDYYGQQSCTAGLKPTVTFEKLSRSLRFLHHRQFGIYIDCVFKSERPADLSVMQSHFCGSHI